MGFDEVGMSRVRVGGTVRAHEGFGVRQLARGDIRVTSTTGGVPGNNKKMSGGAHMRNHRGGQRTPPSHASGTSALTHRALQ